MFFVIFLLNGRIFTADSLYIFLGPLELKNKKNEIHKK